MYTVTLIVVRRSSTLGRDKVRRLAAARLQPGCQVRLDHRRAWKSRRPSIVNSDPRGGSAHPPPTDECHVGPRLTVERLVVDGALPGPARMNRSCGMPALK